MASSLQICCILASCISRPHAARVASQQADSNNVFSSSGVQDINAKSDDIREARRARFTLSSRPSVEQTQSLSSKQSFGFIDETDERWAMRKQIHLAQLAREQKIHGLFDDNKGQIWWQYHQEPSFHCEFMQRVGNVGDGGKWMCDPHLVAKNVAAGEPCLVYSVGSRGQFDFESGVQDTIGKGCEIHIFDPSPAYKVKTPPNMFYHAYALGTPGQTVDGVAAKSLSQAVKELGHAGRKLQAFKIDCEGCEWDTFEDWMKSGLDMQQIMVELHWRDNAKRIQEFYKTMADHGYVIFSKEPNTEGCNGDCIEYSFLKLDPSFSKA